MKTPTYTVFRSEKDRKWYAHLRGANGENVFPTQSYDRKREALHPTKFLAPGVKVVVLEYVKVEYFTAPGEARIVLTKEYGNARQRRKFAAEVFGCAVSDIKMKRGFMTADEIRKLPAYDN